MTPSTPPLAGLDAPQELKNLKQWLVWRYEPAYDKDGNRIPKDLKKPYYANGSARFGAQGTELDRRKLVTFAQAKAAAIVGGFTGIGVAMLKGTPYTALDYDNCVTEGVIDAGVLATTQGTYTEYSPSGNGIRAFVVGELGSRKDCKDAAEGIGFEMFNTSGFVTFTGNITLETEVDGAGISTPNKALTALIHERFGPRADRDMEYTTASEGLTEEQLSAMLAKVNPDMGYHDWLHIGMALHHETQGEGFHLWDAWSAAGVKYRGPEEMFGKWKGFGNNAEQPVTINTLRKLLGEAGAVDASADDFEVITEEEIATQEKALAPVGGYFKFQSADEFEAEYDSDDEWIIEGFLPKGEMGMVFGAPASGKSFLSFDMACAVARGVPWNGRDVTQGSVLYVVAEAPKGARKRLKAYREHHNVAPGMDITIVGKVVPNLIDPKSVKRLIADIKASGKQFSLIIMDTFARVTPGANENSGEDMGAALSRCGEISAASGAMVILVHHSGKDTTKGTRGWSGIAGAMEVILEVERAPDKVSRSVTIAKLKDGDDTEAAQGFKLHTMLLGHTPKGREITSCIVEYTDSGRVERAKTRKLGDTEQAVLGAISTNCNMDNSISEEKLLGIVVKEAGPDPKGNARTVAKRALTSLSAKNYILRAGGMLTLVQDDAQ